MERRRFLGLTAAVAAIGIGPACEVIDAVVDPPADDTGDTGDTDLPRDPELVVGERHLDWNVDGNLYEVIPLEHLVRRLDANESVLWEITELNHPEGIVHSPTAGHIYVLDKGNSQVVVLNASTGAVENIISEHGDQDGQTGHIVDAAIDDLGQLVIVDPHNHRIQVFSPEGEFISGFGEFGTDEEHHLNWPRAIAIDHQQQVHVVDRGNARIQVFDENGVWIRQYGGGGLLSSPRAIAIDAQGRSYVADLFDSLVHVFDETGTQLSAMAIEIDGFPAHPTHLNWTPDGDLYVRVSHHRQREAF